MLELELFHPRLVGRDCGAFDPGAVLFDGIGRLHRDAIVRCVAALDREVVIFEFYIEVGVNELVAYVVPNAVAASGYVSEVDALRGLTLSPGVLRVTRSSF